jgi:transcriptional regulator with XRE-family HTH domain
MGSNPALGKQFPPRIQSQDVDYFPMAKEINPYQANFKQAVKDLRLSRGITLQAVADMLGLDLDTLHDYLYKPHSRPGRDPLKLLSGLTGRPMSDFDDDPGAPPEGVTDDSSEMDRFMLRTMGKDLNKLTDTQKRNALEQWNAMMRGYESSK